MPSLDYLQEHFGLSDNEVRLLRFLMGGSFSVVDLSNVSHVPMGRIYTVLSDLERKKLVSHGGYPRVYTSQPWSDKVLDFLNHKHEELQRHKSVVIDSLEERHSPSVELITSMAQFKSQFFSWVSGSKFLYYVDTGLAYPLVFYSPSESETLRIIRALNPHYHYTEEKRKNRELFWKNFKSFDDLRHVVEEKTLHYYLKTMDEKFGRDYLLERISDTKRLMKLYNNKIRVISGLFSNRVVISDNYLITSTYLNDRVLVLKVGSPSIIRSHKEWFEDLFDEAIPYDDAVNDWLKKNPPSKKKTVILKAGE